MSLSSFRTVCFATPVMRQVALTEVPSTSAAMTWVRLSVARRFMELASPGCEYIDIYIKITIARQQVFWYNYQINWRYQ